MIRILFLANIIFLLSLNGCITTPEINSGSVEVYNEDVHVKVAFNENDRYKIKRYYDRLKKNKKIPPGLTKKQELPPGLHKQIEKKGVLPPGLESRRLPTELERQLSYLPEEYVRVKVGGDVVLMNKKTRVIFDVILGVDN